jgi:hypothetical protein
MVLQKPIEHKLVAQLAYHAFCNYMQCYTTPVDTDANSRRQRCKYAQWMRLGGVQAEHFELLKPVISYCTCTQDKEASAVESVAEPCTRAVRPTLEHTMQTLVEIRMEGTVPLLEPIPVTL